jgi:hypothetical protein
MTMALSLRTGSSIAPLVSLQAVVLLRATSTNVRVESLYALHIVPGPVPLEDRDPGELSIEETRELLRIYQKVSIYTLRNKISIS